MRGLDFGTCVFRIPTWFLCGPFCAQFCSAHSELCPGSQGSLQSGLPDPLKLPWLACCDHIKHQQGSLLTRLLHLNVGWLLFSLPSPPSVCSANSCSPRSLGKAGPSMTHLPLGGTNKAFLLPVLPGLPLIMVLIMLSGIHLGLLSH